MVEHLRICYLRKAHIRSLQICDLQINPKKFADFKFSASQEKLFQCPCLWQMEQPAEWDKKNSENVKTSRPATGDMWVLARPKQWKSQSVMTCNELDETEQDILLMDLLDRWELPHKIQDSRFKTYLRNLRLWNCGLSPRICGFARPPFLYTSVYYWYKKIGEK